MTSPDAKALDPYLVLLDAEGRPLVQDDDYWAKLCLMPFGG